jgi:hypothetical protein
MRERIAKVEAKRTILGSDPGSPKRAEGNTWSPKVEDPDDPPQDDPDEEVEELRFQEVMSRGELQIKTWMHVQASGGMSIRPVALTFEHFSTVEDVAFG